MISTKLKVDDEVVVIAGKDKGKKGKILKIDRNKNKVLVEGVNVGTYSQRKTEQDTGGLLKKEFYLHLSNVMFFDQESSKGVKLGLRIDEDKEGKKKKKIRYMKNQKNEVIKDADSYVKKEAKSPAEKGIV